MFGVVLGSANLVIQETSCRTDYWPLFGTSLFVYEIPMLRDQEALMLLLLAVKTRLHPGPHFSDFPGRCQNSQHLL